MCENTQAIKGMKRKILISPLPAPHCRERQQSLSGYLYSTLYCETTALVYQKHDLHFKILGFLKPVQIALKAWLRWW